MDKMGKKGFFHDAKIQVAVLILVVVSELIGIQAFSFGPIRFSLLPMLYALILGILLSQVKLISYEEMVTASPYIGISVTYLTAYVASGVGPNLQAVIKAGPALILQELGNLGTIFFSLPIAVLLLKMDRTAVGAAFSTSRESSLAIVGELYGLDSREGRGVMGAYITGTVLGTILNSILASLFINNVTWFSKESLAMAAGTGSASMMSAALAPILEAFPADAEVLSAYTAGSQVLTSATGMYMSLFVAIPLTNWLYKKLKGRKAVEKELQEMEKEKREQEEVLEEVTVVSAEANIKKENPWPMRIKILVLSGIFASIGNWLSTMKRDGDVVTPLQALPGLLILFIIIILGNAIKDFTDKKGFKFPTIIFIALIATIASIPGFSPFAGVMSNSLAKISLLPLATPILAYAGVSTGKDLAAFKEQGIKIILIALLALSGTFIGSAVIANIVLKFMG
jgi:DUF3100 family protein